MKLRTFIQLGASLMGPQLAHADTMRFVMVCHTEGEYQWASNQLSTLITSGVVSPDNLTTTLRNAGCIQNHWKAGDPPYKILDTNGGFVLISNGTNTGYMNGQDYDEDYVVGIPTAPTPSQ
jgi:hypothetical protein